MQTHSLRKYMTALLVIRHHDLEFYEGYMRPRLVSRSAMWTSWRIPSSPTFGIHTNNFVEATHHSVKRHNLNRRVNLWQAVERTNTIFEHILRNRQVAYITSCRGQSKIDGQPNLDVLCSNLVPKAVMLVAKHLRNSHNITVSTEDEVISVLDDDRRQEVNPESWTCNCRFASDYLLPCRHSLAAYIQFHGTAGNNLCFV